MIALKSAHGKPYLQMSVSLGWGGLAMKGKRDKTRKMDTAKISAMAVEYTIRL